MYYPPETLVTPLTTIRRERLLPAPGRVVVRAGQRVEPIQVVARADLPGDFRIVDVARALAIPASRVKRYLRVRIGDQVRRGQPLASRGFGFLGRTCRSPVDGRLTASGGGRVLIEGSPETVELRAYLPGSVVNVMPNHGVVIETTGALVQGAWGAGGESFGVLKVIAKGPAQPLRAKLINAACHGTIVIGGSRLDEATLERALELQVRGIVTGGLPPELISRVEALPFPVVVTEGFGSDVPMSADVFRLLSANDGREAAIKGDVRTRWGVVRPEVIIPLPAEGQPSASEQPGTPLTVGARVRVVRAPYLGAVGTVTALPPRAVRIATGARLHGAEVDLGDGQQVFVPLANLELVR